MKWSQQAEQEISRVPFFVRKRVRKRVEEEAARTGAAEVRLEHVRSCQKKFLSNMESEVKGYQVEGCFGPGGCPNRAAPEAGMIQALESLLARKNLKEILKERVRGPLKMHHEFRVSVSDCPNACSRPQIVDVGLIGACKPLVSEEEPCSRCGACVESCREGALVLAAGSERPTIDEAKCLACGQCLAACPTGTLREAQRGYRILVGGKLGRHPQLGMDLGILFTAQEALQAVEKCIDHYLEHSRSGERLGEILRRTHLQL
jgi:anaerobic sulfite reductase subunit C